MQQLRRLQSKADYKSALSKLNKASYTLLLHYCEITKGTIGKLAQRDKRISREKAAGSNVQETQRRQHLCDAFDYLTPTRLLFKDNDKEHRVKQNLIGNIMTLHERKVGDIGANRNKFSKWDVAHSHTVIEDGFCDGIL
jgi:hypothetical protein